MHTTVLLTCLAKVEKCTKAGSVTALTFNNFSTSAAAGHHSFHSLVTVLVLLAITLLPSRDFQSGLDQDTGLALTLFNVLSFKKLTI